MRNFDRKNAFLIADIVKLYNFARIFRICEYLFNFIFYMKNKTNRLSAITELVNSREISSQEDLLQALTEAGFSLTQATLSRDLKQLKISRTLTDKGSYRYQATVPVVARSMEKGRITGGCTLAFSGSLAVLKTRSGFAGGIAAELDEKTGNAVLGTIAGDDTILIIPREGISRKEITTLLSSLIDNLSLL